jgi:hypothetical protein
LTAKDMKALELMILPESIDDEISLVAGIISE